jgi:hypothetical protein
MLAMLPAMPVHQGHNDRNFEVERNGKKPTCTAEDVGSCLGSAAHLSSIVSGRTRGWSLHQLLQSTATATHTQNNESNLSNEIASTARLKATNGWHLGCEP